MRAYAKWKRQDKGSHAPKFLDCSICSTGSSKPHGIPGQVSITLRERVHDGSRDSDYFHMHMDKGEAQKLVKGLTEAIRSLEDMTTREITDATTT